ncbi:hypothetical protein A20C1_02464 [marine actinobacterium PHSC20C1]|nr:hypothetical protein A20C1_02464 [marine actinobacterium PHSC20C1]
MATLLIVVAVIAFLLFRKAVALMHDLSELVDKTAELDIDSDSLSKPQIAVLAEMSEIRARHEDHKNRRGEVKLARHERRISRAKRITKRDASATEWPEGWA